MDDDGPASRWGQSLDGLRDATARSGIADAADREHEVRAVVEGQVLEAGQARPVIAEAADDTGRTHREPGGGVRVGESHDVPPVGIRRGRVGDDAGMLTAADQHESVARHGSSRIGGLVGGLGGRHAAMISAILSPARPSASAGRAALAASRKAGVRASRSASATATGSDVASRTFTSRSRPAWRPPTFTAGRP